MVCAVYICVISNFCLFASTVVCVCICVGVGEGFGTTDCNLQ